MSKELKFVMLLDFYGELLTEKQRDVMELYYCEDLSLSEIGNPMGITRQAVRSFIKRGEEILLNYEEKLGFAQRLSKMQDCFNNINDAVQSVDNENVRNAIIKEVRNGLELLI